jgi:hypothetical protein
MTLAVEMEDKGREDFENSSFEQVKFMLLGRSR